MVKKTKTISFRVSQEIYDFLQKVAREKDVYPSSVMYHVALNWIKNYGGGRRL